MTFLKITMLHLLIFPSSTKAKPRQAYSGDAIEATTGLELTIQQRQQMTAQLQQVKIAFDLCISTTLASKLLYSFDWKGKTTKLMAVCFFAYYLQHVQLLTQVFMLSCAHPGLCDETHQCKQYVEELAVFHDKAVHNSTQIYGSLSADLSMFCTPGISDAYRYVLSNFTFKELSFSNL